MPVSTLASLGSGSANSAVNFGSPMAHYDASVLGLSDGATIAAWPDLTGTQGNHVGSGGTVIYKAAAQNGLGVVEIPTNADYCLATWNVVPTRPFTCIMAAKSLSAVAAQSMWFHLTFGITFFATGTQWQIGSGATIQGGTQDTNFHVWTWLLNGASSVLRVDGVQIATGDTGSSAAAGALNQILGGSRYGEFYCYNSDATGLGTEAFMRTKWGTA